MRRVLLATGLLALSVPVPALAGGGCHRAPDEGATATVVTEYACFSPAVNRVAVGTTVTWVNTEATLPHDLTGSAEVFGSQPLLHGKPLRIRFGESGTFPYSCTLHPGMTGVVVVGDGRLAASSAAPAVTLLADPVADTVAVEDADAATWTRSPAALGGAGAGVLGIGAVAGFAFGRRRTG